MSFGKTKREMRAGLAFQVGVLALIGNIAAHAQTRDSADTQNGIRIENDLLSMWLMPRTPQQVAAFYEARGFPQEAIDLLKQKCFLTVGIRNRSDRVIWLQLNEWRFLNTRTEVQRLDQSYWKARWQRLDLPQANRSTFGWTVLPEVRDLHPHEPVGGNIILPKTDSAFTLEAPFEIGIDRGGEQRLVRVPNLRCANDSTQP